MKNTSPDWSRDKSSAIYGVPFWGAPYFSINKKGRAQIHPQGERGPSLDLFQTVKDLKKNSSLRFPMLLRFPEIIASQIRRLHSCFEKAIRDNDYKGGYYGVFPIKVNQQSHIVQDIVRAGERFDFGLEAGSKPELLIALALMKNPKRLIICNGFKDKDYLEMALLAQKAGKNIILVLERRRELEEALQLSKMLKIKPSLGFRLKLSRQAEGLWGESSGRQSKFGFHAEGLISAFEYLKRLHLLECVRLVHFHIGSQAPSIQPVKRAVKEAGRVMGELCRLGCPVQYMDVGGGLGVDYDGSGATRSSTNYDVQEYANDIVHSLQSVCDAMKVPHPHIISESGRFITAQSSLLAFDVVDYNIMEPETTKPLTAPPSAAPAFLKDLWEIHQNLKRTSLNESFNDLIEKKREIHQLFIYTALSLKEMAAAEKICWKTAARLREMARGKADFEDIFHDLDQQLTDTYFCNFSVFQSLPDSWALSYIFPVMPLHRLLERPERKARLADLTCDSDGVISKFIDYETWEIKGHLPLHAMKDREPYLLAVFLTGAYQEILGDLHNLFGDTDAVHLRVIKPESYSIERYVEGDSIAEVLKYVEFHPKELLEKMRAIMEKSAQAQEISRKEAGRLLKKFEQSLFQYTYLKKH